MKTAFLTLSLGCALLLSSCSDAPKKNPATSDNTNNSAEQANLNDMDREFMMKAAHGNRNETEAGKMAAQKATNANVKSFGSMMATDHSGAYDELKALGDGMNMSVPTEPDQEHMEMANDMMKLSGKDFDEKYIDAQVKDHEKTVDLFEKEIKDGQHPDIKAYATKYLPVIKTHLTHAKELADQF